jgi:hypothetical protein
LREKSSTNASGRKKEKHARVEMSRRFYECLKQKHLKDYPSSAFWQVPFSRFFISFLLFMYEAGDISSEKLCLCVNGFICWH